MRNLLYLVTSPTPPSPELIPAHHPPENEASVVLMQEGMVHRQIPAERIYILQDHPSSSDARPVLPTVSYQDLVRMIFEADSVVAL